jgi:hypothetical protein
VASSIRSALVAGAVLSLIVVSACSKKDERLDKLSKGIGKDSVLAVMGVEKAQRIVPYLASGHYIEAMYFTKPGPADSASVVLRNMSPVVMIDGKVIGWGWSTWDSVAANNAIELPPKK